jgi:hypothetical protein
MIKIEVYGSIKDHKLILPGRKKLEQELLDCVDCEIVLTIKKRGKRSNAQNSFYHAVVVETIRHRLFELGHRVSHEEVHEELKRRFLTEYLYDEHGTVVFEKGGSTTELNKSEFSDFIERIREWASKNMSIDIPDADKSLTLL